MAMTRAAEIFYLRHLDYSPIKSEIEFDKEAISLSKDIAILKNPNVAEYIILSVSEKVDNIIKKHGGVKLSKEDLRRSSIKNGDLNHFNFQFGEKGLTQFV